MRINWRDRRRFTNFSMELNNYERADIPRKLPFLELERHHNILWFWYAQQPKRYTHVYTCYHEARQYIRSRFPTLLHTEPPSRRRRRSLSAPNAGGANVCSSEYNKLQHNFVFFDFFFFFSFTLVCRQCDESHEILQLHQNFLSAATIANGKTNGWTSNTKWKQRKTIQLLNKPAERTSVERGRSRWGRTGESKWIGVVCSRFKLSELIATQKQHP